MKLIRRFLKSPYTHHATASLTNILTAIGILFFLKISPMASFTLAPISGATLLFVIERKLAKERSFFNALGRSILCQSMALFSLAYPGAHALYILPASILIGSWAVTKMMSNENISLTVRSHSLSLYQLGQQPLRILLRQPYIYFGFITVFFSASYSAIRTFFLEEGPGSTLFFTMVAATSVFGKLLNHLSHSSRNFFSAACHTVCGTALYIVLKNGLEDFISHHYQTPKNSYSLQTQFLTGIFSTLGATFLLSHIFISEHKYQKDAVDPPLPHNEQDTRTAEERKIQTGEKGHLHKILSSQPSESCRII